MRHRGTPVSRDALYEEVWSDPVTVVALRYGLSDVGLVKICKRLSIPVPTRGYWAKLKSGQVVGKTPLPALPSTARGMVGPVPLSEQEAASHARIREAVQQSRDQSPTLVVPPELVNPHLLVQAAAARLRRREGWNQPAGIRSAPKEVLDIQVTQEMLERALLLMDTLLKALDQHGFTACIDQEKGESFLARGETTLSISLIETVKRSVHIATRAEERARDRYYSAARAGAHISYPSIPQFDWNPTGKLVLKVGSWPSRTWSDTERSTIETRMGGIVPVIVGQAEEKRARQEEAQARQHAYEKARATYEHQVRLRTEEHLALRTLLRDAARLQRANRVREFISAVVEQARRNGEMSPEKQQWITWAQAKADWLDPLIQRSDPILDAPEPEPPRFW